MTSSNAKPTKWDAPSYQRQGAKDWWDLYAKDHHFLRTRWRNLYQLDDMMWRSNQPSPKQIADIASRGIKNILNLRGPRSVGTWQLEAEACARHGLRLYDFTARSRAAPDKQMLHDAKALFECLDGPSLMHCKSGADRTGIVSAIYKLHILNAPFEEARMMLSIKFLHLNFTKTGILDYVIDCYGKHIAHTPMSFKDWVLNEYDQEASTAAFDAMPFWKRIKL